MRIIAGEYRGRKLLSPEGTTTRPILDRVKLALFNMLMGRFDGATVADLFCGTGSLGLECLSRGAAQCVFAERDPSALKLLNANIDTFRCRDRCTIWTRNIETTLADNLVALDAPLDLVFLDPPYALAEQWAAPEQQAGAEQRILRPIAAHLADDGIVIFRTPRSLVSAESLAGLALARRRAYGSMVLNLYQRPEAP